ncbi:MAG: hypothetical protein WAV16_04175 [Candidatus Moraniibacteriota bacterium]
MSENNKKLELTEKYYAVSMGHHIKPSSLNAREWLHLVNDSLRSCETILPRVAVRRKQSMKMADIWNHPIEGCHDEHRVTSQKIIDNLPRTLTYNDSWMFIPIVTLEAKEEKGQFFERKLFILADLARLIIVDTTFRKNPQPNQAVVPGKIPKINEDVVACQVYWDRDFVSTPGEFEELIMSYFADPKIGLGEEIIKHVLDYAVTELREMREAVSEAEKTLLPFLEIRKRLGYDNIL